MSRMMLACGWLVTITACSGVGGGGGSACATDEDCGSQVCARTHQCFDADRVRRVMTRWTLNGLAASTAQCATDGSDHLEITYTDDATGDPIGFAPVPCGQGQFLVDVWPIQYTSVRLEAFRAGGVAIGIGSRDLGPTGDADVTIDLAIRATAP
jgi:hypothetical protein